MTFIVLSALLISSLIYILMGVKLSRKNTSLGDLFPIVFGKNASVKSVDEFSTSTVATTVSLATIILAYFELAGYFGLWLLWTALTTAIGMILVSLAAKRIWSKMSNYSHRPSMHEFLGVEFNSKNVALIASACTSIGFLLIFATELVVGSVFLAGLVPQVPQWVTVLFLSLIGFTYTLLGGFRAVIKTDQLQMKFIWALIIVLAAYYIFHIATSANSQASINQIPKGVLDFSAREGLGFFILGIAVMNIPTHISNMAVWQRISGAQDPQIVVKGIRRSVWGVGLSWGFLSLLACLAFMIVTPTTGNNLLTDLLNAIGGNPFGKIVVFITVLGLYGAMLSTASTNLIVVGHTISEDIVAKLRKKKLTDRIDSNRELRISRIILLVATLLAIFLVEGLKQFGFSIADLVFAIYGGSLALFPLVLVSLYSSKEKLSKLSTYATLAVILGFLSGWGAAIYGKVIEDGNLIFLSPGISIFVSWLMIQIGRIMQYRVVKKNK